jgi:hypothetical protein
VPETVVDLVEGLLKALELSKALYVDVEATECFDQVVCEDLVLSERVLESTNRY